MDIDLKNSGLYEKEILNLDKSINIIFGKNGTGKTTLVKLIKEQNNELDLRIFQGFESVIGQNQKLNAVILGEENNEINKKIKDEEEKIKSINVEIEKIRKEIEQPENDSDKNYFTNLKNANQEREKLNESIQKFYTNSARIISNINLAENARNYNKVKFEEEIKNSKLLTEKEKENLEKTLNLTKERVKEIELPSIDFSKFLLDTNKVLLKKVEAKIIINELQSDTTKLRFAEEGLKIHNSGEKCSFCGNIISDDRIKKLEKYFSEDEIKFFKNEIKELKNEIDNKIKKLKSIEIDEDKFYPQYISQIEKLRIELFDDINLQINFFKILKENLDEKEKNIFEIMDKIEIELPVLNKNVEVKLKSIIGDNNKFIDNLLYNRKLTKQKLRYHKIKELIDEFKLDEKKIKLSNLEINEKKARELINEKENEIKEKKEEEKVYKKNITDLQEKTRSTRKLVENINKKLKKIVSFSLVYKEENGQEYYEIKDLDNEVRDIKKMSTGEKNIVAFLYFIEKLNELNLKDGNKEKIVIFDDPMNSNDDAMQYFISEELKQIMKKCDRGFGKFILLTHNTFFYLNVTHDLKIQRSESNPFEKYNFYKLLSNGKKRKILKIKNNKQDFKTNYEALWSEVAFLYSEEKPDMMLNLIRRIIETFIVFNGMEDFYKENREAKNLFNTNSHYFSDIEADLNGKTKDDIIKILKQCFEDNNHLNHFNKHWKNAKKQFKASCIE